LNINKEKTMEKNKPQSKNSFYFTLLCMCFVTILILSNIAASNTININPFISLSAAELLFPLSYIIGDLIVEIYGFKKARQVIVIGLAITLFSCVFLYITTLLPTGYDEYNTVFGFLTGGVIGITIASILAYLVGSLSNAYIMQRLKEKHKEKKFFLRAMVSTLVGESLDSLFFITFCCIFASQYYSWDRLISFVITITVAKVLFETILFPLTKYLRKIIIKKEQA